MESTDEGSLPTHHRFGSGTADAIVAGLKEENSRLREGSLRRLYSIVDRCWSEISDAIPLIEELSEDDLSFLPPGHPDDSGAHEGGRQSRPGSTELGTI